MQKETENSQLDYCIRLGYNSEWGKLKLLFSQSLGACQEDQ